MVVTGDHVATATSIARGAGIDVGRVVTGAELATWSDDRLRRELGDLAIVARAAPEDKLRLVDSARALGRTVAVTGDGVNDAPALQHADVAVAMGSGTAVARDASDLVLGDDAFPTLLFGLREGRRIVANVQKGLVFLVSTHVALLGFILIATIGGYDQPLLPIQILWLELFIDLATSIAFEREPEEPGAMERRPRPRDRPLLTTSLLTRIAGAGGFSAGAAFLVLLLHDGPPEQVRWLAYTMLVVSQAVEPTRSESQPTGAVAPAEWVPRRRGHDRDRGPGRHPADPAPGRRLPGRPARCRGLVARRDRGSPRRFSLKRSGGGRAGIGWRDRRPGPTGHPDRRHGTFGTAGRPRRSPRWSHGDTRRAPSGPDPTHPARGPRRPHAVLRVALGGEPLAPFPRREQRDRRSCRPVLLWPGPRASRGARRGAGRAVARPAPIIVGHLCLEPSGAQEVEMAVAVADAWQRHGSGAACSWPPSPGPRSTRSTACGHRCCRRTSPSSVFFGRWGTT